MLYAQSHLLILSCTDIRASSVSLSCNNTIAQVSSSLFVHRQENDNLSVHLNHDRDRLHGTEVSVLQCEDTTVVVDV